MENFKITPRTKRALTTLMRANHCCGATTDERETIAEIAKLIQGVGASDYAKFVQLLSEYFTPTDVVLILRAAREATLA